MVKGQMVPRDERSSRQSEVLPLNIPSLGQPTIQALRNFFTSGRPIAHGYPPDESYVPDGSSDADVPSWPCSGHRCARPQGLVGMAKSFEKQRQHPAWPDSAEAPEKPRDGFVGCRALRLALTLKSLPAGSVGALREQRHHGADRDQDPSRHAVRLGP
jgi:hypothetical protein